MTLQGLGGSHCLYSCCSRPHKQAAESGSPRHVLIESLKTINYQSFHSSCGAKDRLAIKGTYPLVSRGLFVIKM